MKKAVGDSHIDKETSNKRCRFHCYRRSYIFALRDSHE